MQFDIIKKMAETNDSSQSRFEGDIFKKEIGKTVKTPKPLLTGSEQIIRMNEIIKQQASNFRLIDKGKRIFYITKEGNRDEVILEDDAVLQREPSKERANRWNYYLLLPVHARKIFDPDDIQYRTLHLGKSIESYAPIKTISKKKIPKIMPELRKHFPELVRLKLLLPEVSLPKVG